MHIKNYQNQLADSFKTYLLEDGKARKTIVSYMWDINSFLKWLSTKDTQFTGELKRFYITSYKSHLIDSSYTVNTINKKINSLHAFNHFLIEQNHMTKIVVNNKKDKLKIAKGSEKEVSVFSEIDIERILFYIQDEARVSIRDKLVFSILFYTRVRVSELVAIKIKDIDFLTMRLTLVGKGMKTRTVPLKEEVINVINEYMDTERKDSKYSSSDYLLLTQRSKKMDRDTINKILKKHSKILDIKMHPHKFRHTFCSRLVKMNVPITTVAKLAGHANIQTTSEFYINTSHEDKMNAVELL